MPPMPHAAVSRPVRHCEPAQQPLGQLLELQVEVAQVPPVQVLPPQSRHARPPVPHATGVSPKRQRPPMQQPAQEAAVH